MTKELILLSIYTYLSCGRHAWRWDRDRGFIGVVVVVIGVVVVVIIPDLSLHVPTQVSIVGKVCREIPRMTGHVHVACA